MDIRAIVTDLDWTLLDSQKNLPQENVEILQKAYDKGIMIVPSTGRYYMAVSEEVRKLPFVRYFIIGNGAEVYDAKEDRVIHSAYVPKEDIFLMMDYLDKLPVLYDVIMGSEGWMSKHQYDAVEETIRTVVAVQQLILKIHKIVPDLRTFVQQTDAPIQKMQLFTDDRALREKLLKEMPEIFPQFSVTSSSLVNIEFNNIRATKGNALPALCEEGGFGIENVLCIGDGLNDVTMIAKGGVGVAMGGSVPEVLAVADYVTEDCDHHGFYNAIQKFCF